MNARAVRLVITGFENERNAELVREIFEELSCGKDYFIALHDTRSTNESELPLLADVKVINPYISHIGNYYASLELKFSTKISEKS